MQFLIEFLNLPNHATSLCPSLPDSFKKTWTWASPFTNAFLRNLNAKLIWLRTPQLTKQYDNNCFFLLLDYCGAFMGCFLNYEQLGNHLVTKHGKVSCKVNIIKIKSAKMRFGYVAAYLTEGSLEQPNQTSYT